jgi:hypothetical protein
MEVAPRPLLALSHSSYDSSVRIVVEALSMIVAVILQHHEVIYSWEDEVQGKFFL